jgi:hypothetical protein
MTGTETARPAPVRKGKGSGKGKGKGKGSGKGTRRASMNSVSKGSISLNNNDPVNRPVRRKTQNNAARPKNGLSFKQRKEKAKAKKGTPMNHFVSLNHNLPDQPVHAPMKVPVPEGLTKEEQKIYENAYKKSIQEFYRDVVPQNPIFKRVFNESLTPPPYIPKEEFMQMIKSGIKPSYMSEEEFKQLIENLNPQPNSPPRSHSPPYIPPNSPPRSHSPPYIPPNSPPKARPEPVRRRRKK